MGLTSNNDIRKIDHEYAPLHYVVRVDGQLHGRFDVFEDAEDAAVAVAKELTLAKVVVNFSARYGLNGEAMAADYSYGSDDYEMYHSGF